MKTKQTLHERLRAYVDFHGGQVNAHGTAAAMNVKVTELIGFKATKKLQKVGLRWTYRDGLYLIVKEGE